MDSVLCNILCAIHYTLNFLKSILYTRRPWRRVWKSPWLNQEKHRLYAYMSSSKLTCYHSEYECYICGHYFWLIVGFLASSGKKFLHFYNENNLTINTLCRSCNRCHTGCANIGNSTAINQTKKKKKLCSNWEVAIPPTGRIIVLTMEIRKFGK